MKKLTFLLFALLVSAGVNAQTWSIDASHSKVGFSVTHMVISSTTGFFEEYDINVKVPGDDWSKASASATIDVNSINTQNEKRDGHLKSPDFFDVENHPKITFNTKSFKNVEGKSYKITGDLTMRGVTKEVTFDAVFVGVVDDPWGNTRAGWQATADINRQDFGLSWAATNAAGEAVVADKVTMILSLEFIKQ